MTSLQKLRQQRHAQWLCDLQQRIDHVLSQSVPGVSARPDQIYLFGSRARGDWDGLSETDFLQDAIGLDRKAWHHLPQHTSVIWRNVARDALPLLEQQP